MIEATVLVSVMLMGQAYSRLMRILLVAAEAAGARCKRWQKGGHLVVAIMNLWRSVASADPVARAANELGLEVWDPRDGARPPSWPRRSRSCGGHAAERPSY